MCEKSLARSRTPPHVSICPKHPGRSVMNFLSKRWPESMCGHTSPGRTERYPPDAHGLDAVGRGRKIRLQRDYHDRDRLRHLSAPTAASRLLLPLRLTQRPGWCTSTHCLYPSALVTWRRLAARGRFPPVGGTRRMLPESPPSWLKG